MFLVFSNQESRINEEFPDCFSEGHMNCEIQRSHSLPCALSKMPLCSFQQTEDEFQIFPISRRQILSDTSHYEPRYSRGHFANQDASLQQCFDPNKHQTQLYENFQESTNLLTLNIPTTRSTDYQLASTSTQSSSHQQTEPFHDNNFSSCAQNYSCSKISSHNYQTYSTQAESYYNHPTIFSHHIDYPSKPSCQLAYSQAVEYQQDCPQYHEAHQRYQHQHHTDQQSIYSNCHQTDDNNKPINHPVDQPKQEQSQISTTSSSSYGGVQDTQFSVSCNVGDGDGTSSSGTAWYLHSNQAASSDATSSFNSYLSTSSFSLSTELHIEERATAWTHQSSGDLTDKTHKSFLEDEGKFYRRYVCSMKGCKRRFCRADELTRHMRMHTGTS